MIYWSTFTWEAFATLLTGVLAVGAAVYIGRRQVAISDRQGRILEKQVGLDALKHRSDLFERRFEIYEASARFLGAIVTHAAEPDREIEMRFLSAMNASKFLFAPNVAADLKEIWKESCAFFATKSVMRANYDKTGSYGEGMPAKELQQITSLNARLESLSELFGEELRLSDVEA